MVHFDFDDRYQDELVVGSAISRREAILLAIVAHALGFIALVFLPTLSLFQPSPEELEQRRKEIEQAQVEQNQNRTFVFVQPRLEMPAQRPRERTELSDLDRRSQSPERAPRATNPLPLLRGNSTERVEGAEEARARGAESPTPPEPQPESESASIVPPTQTGPPRAEPTFRPAPPTGALGEALRNLEKYVQKETFNNPQGGQTDPGATIQFDSKGVEFGPWLRRFVSRVKRNWFVPLSAMTFRGHVVLQFNIWRDGHITDISILQPAAIDSFNQAAVNAIMTSNPVDPLPPEYPSEKAFFTVTFYYNEQPPN